MVNIKERINTTKKNTIGVQSVMITFILFKCHRCIDKKALDNEEFSRENSKPCLESRISTC